MHVYTIIHIYHCTMYIKLYIHTYKNIYIYNLHNSMYKLYIIIFKFYYNSIIMLPGVSLLRYIKGEYMIMYY